MSRNDVCVNLVIGQFVSPDTIVPEPGRVFGYNRYMHVFGNPLNYRDSSGNYPDEVLMEHFGCDDWACVEAQFDAGGQHEGRWGWLATLMAAEDGDIVTAWSVTESLYQEVQGRFVTRNGTIMVTPTRLYMSSPSWDSPVNLTEFAGDFSELNFAGRGVGLAGMYSSSRGPNTTYDQRYIDCKHHMNDCVDRAQNIAAFGVSVVGAGCAIATAGGCVAAAALIGSGINAIGVVRTGINVTQGNATADDLKASFIWAAVDTVAPPQTGPVISGTQWWMDERERIR